MQSRNSKFRRTRTILTLVCVILAMILAICILASVYLDRLLDRINRFDPSGESTLSPSQVESMKQTDPNYKPIDPSDTQTYPTVDNSTLPTGGTVTQGSHYVNILLVGQDRRENDDERQRSDSMILVTLNKSRNAITLTSFMRDQYVQIPGYAPDKLNTAYQYGGMNLLKDTLALNYGVRVDGVVEVDFSGFKTIIDTLGGVDIDLTAEECEYFNYWKNWGFTTGVNHLTGEQALSYARLRELDTDYRRTQRQRNVITAVLKAYRNQPLDRLLGILDEVLPMLTTDLTNAEIFSYAAEFFPMLSSAQMNSLRIPIEGTYSEGDVEIRPGLLNWFQYDIDFVTNSALLDGIFSKKSN